MVIHQRTKSEARLEAQKQQKLPQQFFDINERFFKDLLESVRNAMRSTNGWYYMFAYAHKNSLKLRDILYKNGSAILFLKRKFDVFEKGIKGVGNGQRAAGMA